MGVLRRIFGTEKNVDTIVSGAVKGLDALVFTAEEKSEANAKVADWFLKYLAATQPQNLARRYIALVIVLLWAFLILAGVVAYAIEGPPAADAGPTVAQFIFEVLNDLVHQPLMMIMGFYFLTHVVRTYQNGSKKND